MLEDAFTEYDVGNDMSDIDVKKRMEEVSHQSKMVRKIGEKIQTLIKDATNEGQIQVDEIKAGYERLLLAKDKYIRMIKSEAEKRDLEKAEKFETSSLNIKLEEFKGYASAIDLYTFQNKFEKLHLKSTPRKLLPQLLKNNFLDEPALTLVKHIDDIDEIWRRLKIAYGDSKTILL